MPFKKSTGNMYDWVTHTHSHLGGECSHECIYCYVQRNPFGVNQRYKGKPRMIDSEFQVNYGSGNIIFIEHMNDLFAEAISGDWIKEILNHCRKYNNNQYVFQSKNPYRVLGWLYMFPKNFLFGTTIETNRYISISKAPNPPLRYYGMECLKNISEVKRLFITIEPIMDFDVDTLSNWIIEIKPEFVNIGADSKGCNLPEPSAEKILQLIDILNKADITIKKKTNLERLLNQVSN